MITAKVNGVVVSLNGKSVLYIQNEKDDEKIREWNQLSIDKKKELVTPLVIADWNESQAIQECEAIKGILFPA